MPVDAVLLYLRARLNAIVAAALLDGAELAQLVLFIEADRLDARVALRVHCPALPPTSADRIPCVIRFRNNIALTSLALRSVGVA